MKRYSNKDAIVASLGYRIGTYHPDVEVQIGIGNTDANVVVVQPHAKMPERDAITGALKNFGMLNDAYRATINILGDHEQNRYYLKELIEIINPLVVVACGPEVVSLLRESKIRSFTSHAGKGFKIKDLKSYICFAVTNPTEYGFARAPLALKAQGKAEWTKLASIYRKLKEKQEKDRWAC